MNLELREKDFIVNITTHMVGELSISSPLSTVSVQKVKVESYQPPAASRSYAIIEDQNIIAGAYLYIKVHVRDLFGNKQIAALDSPDTIGLTAAVYPSEAGRNPTLVDKFMALKQTDGSTVLLNRVKLTETGYYRARVFYKNSEVDLTCTGCFFKVSPASTSLQKVMARDFTGFQSESKARVLKD